MKAATVLVQITFHSSLTHQIKFDNAFSQIVWYVLLCMFRMLTKIIKIATQVSFFQFLTNHFGIK